MEINDNKAGMEGFDKEKVNAVIREASRNSSFAKHKEKHNLMLQERIREQLETLATFSDEKIKLAEIQADKLLEQLESFRDLNSVVIHVDMDCFFAAVEMKDNVKLRNVPMAVGSNSMLSTSNYEARRFGIRAGQPGFIARKLCPDLIIVPPRFDRYRETSDQVRKILLEYDPHLSMSIDEASLDITEYLVDRQRVMNNQKTVRKRKRYGGDCHCRLPYDSSLSIENFKNCTLTEELCDGCGKNCSVFEDTVEFGSDKEDVTHEIRFRIEQITGLTASAGIACNALLAKICSDMNKPNGQYCLPSDKGEIQNFMEKLPIRKVSGIGAVSEAMLKAIDVTVCGDLLKKRGLILLLYSTLSSRFFLKVALGIGCTMLERTDNDRKSISVERTFTEVKDPEKLLDICKTLCEKLAEDIVEEDVKGRTVTVKFKTVEFDVKTRAQSCQNFLSESSDIFKIAANILQNEIDACRPKPLRLRLMGVRLSSLIHRGEKSVDSAKSIKEYFKPNAKDNRDMDRYSTIEHRIEEKSKNIQPECHMDILDNNIEPMINNDSNCTDDDDVQVISYSKEHQLSVLEKEAENANSNLNIQIDSTLSKYSCPVCNFNLKRVKTLDDFNKHIDDCLSRQTVKDSIKEINREFMEEIETNRRVSTKGQPKSIRKRKFSKTSL